MSSRPRLATNTISEETEGRLGPEEMWDSADKLPTLKLRFLWPGRIIEGSIVVVEGQKGVGKSSVCIALAANVTAGIPLPGKKKSKERGSVLWLASEENFRSVVKPRLIASGADLKRIKPLKTRIGDKRGKLTFPSGIDLLQESIEYFDAKLIIVDPWISCLDPNLSPKDEQQIRSALDPLNHLMMETGCVTVITRHWTKDSSADRIDRGIGSVAIAATARSVLAIDWPDRKSPRRVLRVTACNESSFPPSIEYSLLGEPGVPTMGDYRELSPHDDDPDGDTADLGERDARGDARKLLLALLAEGPVPYSSVVREATTAGVSERTLRAVKVDLGIRSIRIGRSVPPHWEWTPPKGGFKG